MNSDEAAGSSKEGVRGTSIGYAINLMMDYGSGRQVTISGTLPLHATLKEMNAELDKLRLATNRQSAMVVLRDVENTVSMARRTVKSLELMVSEYDKEIEKELARISGGERANHTTTKSQLENVRSQAMNYRMTKKEEIMRSQADIEKGEVLIVTLKKEIDEG